MGFWKKLASIGASIGSSLIPGGSLAKDAIKAGIGAAGAGLGAAADASASNRGAGIEAASLSEQLNQARVRAYLDALMARQNDRRENTTADRRSAAIADYVLDSGNAGVYRNTRGLPTYGFGNAAPVGQSERDFNAQQRADVARRSAAGGTDLPEVKDPGAFAFDPKLMRPGTLERIASVAAPTLTAVGALGQTDPLAGLDAEHRKALAAALKRYGIVDDDGK